MKKNPFYGISAAAMLLGCYMVSAALRLEPGQVGKLQVLIGVLQVYEALLIALGVFLVSSGRAPRDGVTVLLLETLFLVDATLLATECVTAEVGLGTVTALALAVLALVKLGVVHRVVPELLPARSAVLLGVHGGLVLALPVGAAFLASARVLDARLLYAAWWMTLALPVGRQALVASTRTPDDHRDSPALAVWSWVPAAAVLLHLWSVGWIHQVGFQAAHLAPFVLGLALITRPRQVRAQVLLPALAILLSVSQADVLGSPGEWEARWVSPLRLASVAAAATYAVLAWRHRHPWLVGLAAVTGLTGLVGPAFTHAFAAAGGLWRWVSRAWPRGALAWGVAAVAAAFAFLALGAGTSLRPGGRGRPPQVRRPRFAWGSATLAMATAALAWAAVLLVLDGAPVEKRVLLAHGTWLSMAAGGLGFWALLRASASPQDPPARDVGLLSLLSGGAAFLVVFVSLTTIGHDVPRNETAAIGDVRTVLSAQSAYQSVNGGYFEAELRCLAHPQECLPTHEGDPPAFLDEALASLATRSGYERSFYAGEAPETLPLEGSPTSITSWAYVAVPSVPGETGVRGFCGDSTGHLCSTLDGPPKLAEDTTCDLAECHLLQVTGS